MSYLEETILDTLMVTKNDVVYLSRKLLNLIYRFLDHSPISLGLYNEQIYVISFLMPTELNEIKLGIMDIINKDHNVHKNKPFLNEITIIILN